jgi:hypothetical protein
MKQFDLKAFLDYLTQYGFELEVGFYIVSGIFFLLVLIYVVRKWQGSEDDEASEVIAEAKEELAETVVVTPKRTVSQAAPTPVAPKVVATKTAVVATSAAVPHIPQESVLRRHYLSHIRYMIEVTTFPKPTESVLRRHYEQLVGSILDACVEDAAELDKLIRRYDEYRKAA